MNFKREDFQKIYGDAPADFHLRMCKALDELEETNMNKRYKPFTVLAAAAILALILAGAGIAASQLDIFHLMDTADPIVPLQGAAEMVGMNLGTGENEYAVLTVEQAVFDGQGVMVQCRIAPKDIENYAMLNAFMQEISEEYYDTVVVPVEFGEGAYSTEEQDGTSITISNMNGEQHLLRNGEDVEFPATREEAMAKGLPVYRENGEIYYADLEERKALGRKDGRRMMDWWISMDTDDEMLSENTSDAQEQPDGSVLFWAEGYADEVLDRESIEVRLESQVELDGEIYELDEIRFQLPKSEAERKFRVQPVNGGKLERFELLQGSVVFTKIRGYMQLDYQYEALDDEIMGVTMDLYDAEGKPITIGGVSCYGDESNSFHESLEMQSFAEAPETIWIQVRAIDSERILGEIECRLIEE